MRNIAFIAVVFFMTKTLSAQDHQIREPKKAEEQTEKKRDQKPSTLENNTKLLRRQQHTNAMKLESIKAEEKREIEPVNEN